MFSWLQRACISIESLAQRLHKLHLSQVSGAYYTLSDEKLSRGVSKKICGSAGSGGSVSSRVTLSPSALRTTSLVYPGSLNPITGCAQDRSHGESHPSPHSHPSPPRRWRNSGKQAGGSREGNFAQAYMGTRRARRRAPAPSLTTLPASPLAELREKAGRTGARRRLGLGPRKWTMDGSSVRQDDLIGKLALWRQFPWNVSVECSQLP